MDVNSLKYYIEHQSTNPIPEERVKENKELKTSLIFSSMTQWNLKKPEQIIGRAMRLPQKNNDKDVRFK
jgi:hypothetical protein